MEYTRNEINNKLLNKKLDEFYLVIIEVKNHLLEKDEYESIVNEGIVYNGNNKEETQEVFEELSSSLEKNEMLNQYKDDIMRLAYSFATIRSVTFVTLIDDKVFDVNRGVFLNTNREKIIYYTELSNYLDPDKIRIRIVTPKEDPTFMEPRAVLDTDEPAGYYKFEEDHISQESSDDLTNDFILEVGGPKLSLKRKDRKF